MLGYFLSLYYFITRTAGQNSFLYKELYAS